jgi:hypothetical protein
VAGIDNKPSYEELQQQLADLQSRLPKEKELSLKIADKGGISLYGLGRFPVTLYYEQWIRLLEFAPSINTFLVENRGNSRIKFKS